MCGWSFYSLPLLHFILLCMCWYSSTRHLYVYTHLRVWSWVWVHDKKIDFQMVFNVYLQNVNSVYVALRSSTVIS